MKYICLKNISLFKNELLKYYFLQILFLVIVLLANLNLDETEIIDFVKSILSIKSMSFDNILVTLYVVFSFFLAMLISAKIYIKDTNQFIDYFYVDGSNIGSEKWFEYFTSKPREEVIRGYWYDERKLVVNESELTQLGKEEFMRYRPEY